MKSKDYSFKEYKVYNTKNKRNVTLHVTYMSDSTIGGKDEG